MSPASGNNQDDFFVNWLKKLEQRVTDLEHQQNWGVQDSQGRMRLKGGLQDDGTLGLVAFDAAGNKRVEIGQLADGDYAIATFSPANDGTYQAVFPVASKYSGSVINATSTSYSTGSGSPSLTTALGASGDAVITVSAFIQPSTTGQTGQVGLKIDGGTANDVLELGESSGVIAGNISTSRRLSDWLGAIAPGPHTFTLQQKVSTSGVAVTFGALAILVQPL